MKNIEKIGVILPVYKADNLTFFKLAIISILNQTYTNFELHIGVDGPIELEMHEYLNKISLENNIYIHFFKESRGLACVLNDLIIICFKKKIKFIARMDADDISYKDRLEKQLDFLLKNGDIDVVGGAIEEIDERGLSRRKIIKYPLSHNECYSFFKYRNPLAHPAILFRKSFFDKVGHLYQEAYKKNQDTMLWLDGFKAGCVFSNLPDLVLNYRVTINFFKKRRNGFILAKMSLKDRIKINKALQYNIFAYLYAIVIFIITISPVIVKRFFYKIR